MMRTTNPIYLVALCGLIFAGCGSSGGNELTGSAGSTYDLTFDTVRVQQQTDGGQTFITVRYVRADNGNESFPTIVVVTNPVVGVAADLTASGNALSRVTPSGALTFDLEQGTVTFDALGEPGEEASGSFGAQLVGGSGLRGTFSAPLTAL